jgi:hypothetical protein
MPLGFRELRLRAATMRQGANIPTRASLTQQFVNERFVDAE